MTVLTHPEINEIEITSVMHALSDPQRLEIVRQLAIASDGKPCGSFGLELSKSTVSHHFRVLREAGVIHQTKSGTSKFSVLRREELDDRFPGLLDAVLAANAAPA